MNRYVSPFDVHASSNVVDASMCCSFVLDEDWQLVLPIMVVFGLKSIVDASLLDGLFMSFIEIFRLYSLI